MSTVTRPRTLLPICALLILPACPAAQPAASRAGRERPPEVAPGAANKPPPAAGVPPGNKPALQVSGGQGRPGDVVTVTATLTTAGASIAGTQNDIAFDPKQISVVAKANGKPDCSPNRQLGKEGTAFSFLPPKCQTGTCTGVRALVLSLSNVAAIPNGSVLYTCKVAISAQASPGAHPLSLSHAGFSNPTGQAITAATADGAITVGKP
jgi:hypothetical protein